MHFWIFLSSFNAIIILCTHPLIIFVQPCKMSCQDVDDVSHFVDPGGHVLYTPKDHSTHVAIVKG